MPATIIPAAGLALLLSLAVPATASSLRVSPSLLEVAAPGLTTLLTLRNDAEQPVDVQIRVFRWLGTRGDPILERTPDVVVSPPAVSLAGRSDQVVRVIRLNKAPVTREESYRVLVDEIPKTSREGTGSGIRFALRYSIPVFFSPPSGKASVNWSVQKRKGGITLTAINRGDRRMRLANLRLLDRGGSVVLQKQGLVGYALSGSTTNFDLFGLPAGKEPAKLIVESETGPVHAAIGTSTNR